MILHRIYIYESKVGLLHCRFSIDAFCGFSSNQLYSQTPIPTITILLTSKASGLSNAMDGEANEPRANAPIVNGTITLKIIYAFLVLLALIN